MSPQARAKLLYQLENEELPMGHPFATFEDLTKFANFAARYLSSEFTECPQFIQVKCNGDRDESEAVGPNTIWISKNHWYPSIVLHELAHFLAPDGEEEHGQHFITCYLYALGGFMGTSYARIYKEAFIRNGLTKG